MGKVKRGGYVFVSWIGDHDPKHVHIYKDKKLVGKWDLQNNKIMVGKISKKILKYIQELALEGKL